MTTILQRDDIGEIRIPFGITSISAFRRWATSSKFPERGRFSFLCGTLHVDLSMEELFAHNLIKTRFTVQLDGIVDSEDLGYYFSDGALLSNLGASLSTEPDGVFVSYDTIESGRVRLTKTKKKKYVEVAGSPDMVLEIVSDSSVKKDNEILRELYWKAKVPEYWLVDARAKEVDFNLLRRTANGYEPAPRQAGGWLHSQGFGRSFRLTHKTDRLGHPRYTLEVRN